MSVDSCFERAVAILEEQLESGEIGICEYNSEMRELEIEAAEIESEVYNDFTR